MHDPVARPRPSTTVAVVLSLVAPALGQIYAKRPRRAIAWTLAWIALELPLTWLCTRRSTALGVLVLSLGGLALWIAAAVDARRLARRAEACASKWEIALGFVVILALEWLEGAALRRFVLEPYTCTASDMTPTLLVGDHLLLDRTARDAEPGDVIVFRAPGHPERRLALRVLGVGGDVLELREGRLVRNGQPLARCRVGHASLRDPTTHGEVADASSVEGELFVERLGARAWLTFHADGTHQRRDDASARPIFVPRSGGPWRVAPGELFVLGDDRSRAHDSREGFDGRTSVPLGALDGRARWVGYRDTSTTLRFDRTLLDPGGAPRLPSELRGALAPALRRCLAADAHSDE